MGVDPGLRITGWGVIDINETRPAIIEAGIVRTDGDAPLAYRLRELFDGIGQVIGAHKPKVLAVEELYSHYRHPTTAILMGHARGVIILAAAGAGIPVISYPATRIKKCVTGNGRAAKSQVQHMVASTLGLARIPEPPDVCDALAAALTHFEDGKRRDF